MTREEAWQIVCEFTESESLRKHMLGVETCMRWYAKLHGEDVELWGICGLLHDFDYEKHPDNHPHWGMNWLDERGTDPVIIRAIATHCAPKTGIEPESLLERHLFACDELSGFITACCYVRPSKSVHDLEAKSVTKKLKTLNFAAGVNRDDVYCGAELIGLPLNDHITNLITAMRENSTELGIKGEL